MHDALIDLVPTGGWRGPSLARLVPVASHQMNWFDRLLVKHLERRHHVPARNLFATLLHAPRIFYAWLPFASQLMPYGALTRRQTELVILRTAWCCRCRYEWDQHVQIGRAQGLADDDILRVIDGAGAAEWTDLEATLLQAVDDVVETGVISTTVLAALTECLSPSQITEAVMLIGHYRMLASVIDSLGVQVE